MTAKQIFEIACSFMGQNISDSDDVAEFAVIWLNVLLEESFINENALRAYYDKTLLTQSPFITSLDEEVPYEDVLCRIALPYGLVSLCFSIDDETGSKAQEYRAKYIGALSDTLKIKSESVRDIYA